MSTKVGGIPEVMPDKFIYFVEPEIESIENGLQRAINDVIRGKRPAKDECHKFVKDAYNWRDIASRTELVYTTIASLERKPLEKKVRNLWERGQVAGPLMAVLYLFCHYWIVMLDFFCHL